MTLRAQRQWGGEVSGTQALEHRAQKRKGGWRFSWESAEGGKRERGGDRRK